MTSGRPFMTVFGITDESRELEDGDLVSIAKIAVRAVREGYAVVPLRPLVKVPDVCTLTVREQKVQGKHPCGVDHAITDDALARRIFTRISGTYEGHDLNIGIVAGPSRLINVDADQAHEVEAFLTDWAAADGDPDILSYSPTVTTPGAMVDGEWRHKGGGHFYFTVPDDFDFTTMPVTTLKSEHGYDVRWGMQMSVAPPSRRAEGAYVPRSNILPAPDFLLKMIAERCERAVEMREFRGPLYATDPIAKWSQQVSWAELLVPDKWADTSKTDQCGCPIFEKPGGGSSTYKSATGHEVLCDRWENLEGHGPLHVWTTDPPEPLATYIREHGSSTLTKLSYVAATRYGGNISEARLALGIDPVIDFDSWNLPTITMSAPVDAPLRDEAPVVEDPVEVDDAAEPAVEDGPEVDDRPDPEAILRSGMAKVGMPEESFERVKGRFLWQAENYVAKEAWNTYQSIQSGDTADSMLAEMLAFQDLDLDALVEALPTLLTRTDGQALFYAGRVNWLVGRRAAGKTWAALKTAIQVLEAGGRVVYYDFEDRYELFRERATLLGFDIEKYRKSGAFIYFQTFPHDEDGMAKIADFLGSFDLVVFDVINRMVSRLGGSPDVGNDEVLRLTDGFFTPIASRGAGVLVLDHPNKKGQRRDAELDDLSPGGGAMKMNNASGLVLGMQPVKAFSRSDPEGRVRLVCLKDRLGFHQEGDVVGEFVGFADTNDLTGGLGMSLQINPPKDDVVIEDEGLNADIARCRGQVLKHLGERGPLPLGTLKGFITKSLHSMLGYTLDTLVTEGRIILGDDKRYACVSDE